MLNADLFFFNSISAVALVKVHSPAQILHRLCRKKPSAFAPENAYTQTHQKFHAASPVQHSPSLADASSLLLGGESARHEWSFFYPGLFAAREYFYALQNRFQQYQEHHDQSEASHDGIESSIKG